MQTKSERRQTANDDQRHDLPHQAYTIIARLARPQRARARERDPAAADGLR